MRKERNIQNPEDFLKYLQNLYSETIFTSSPDIQMIENVRKVAKKFGTDINTSGTHLNFVVKSLASEVLEALTQSQRAKVEANVAIGLLDHPNVNAAIIKGLEGYSAVVLNSGFMMALNKYLKLVQAMYSPNAVIYCNRGEHTKLKSKDYAQFLSEFIYHYRTEKIPLGPRLLMSNEVSARVSISLNAAERFAICHEIGHFLNGDLDNNHTLIKLAAGINKLNENKDWDCEYAADKTGFEIFLRITGAQDKQSVKVALLGVIGAFDFIYMIDGGDATNGHPAPLERGLRLAHTFLGAEAEKLLRASYKDPKLILDF